MPPNILFLLVDCLRADRVVGARTAVTPVLDGLRQHGATFSEVIASASSTTPCVASLFTGLYPFAHGLQALSGLRLRPGVETLAERLAALGYHTLAEATGPLSTQTGIQRGFESFHSRDRQEYLSGRWGDRLIERLAGGALPEPWFLFLHVWELHLPRQVPPGFNSRRYGATLYDRALSALDGRLGQVLAAAGPDTLVLVHGDHGEGLMDRPWDNWLMALWQPFKSRLPAGMLRAVYGRMTGLFKRGRRTPKFSGMGHAFELFDYLIRVPLILRGPGVPEGVWVQEQARQVDILPTLIELAAGRQDWAALHGRSLAPALAGAQLPVASAYSEEHGVATDAHSAGKVSLRRPPYKLVCSGDLNPGSAALFDLAADPDETRSVAAQHPAMVDGLLAEVAALRAGSPTGPAAAPELMDDEEMEVISARLRELGYME